MKKPDILDFRNNKIAGGSLAAIGVFRKHLSSNAKQSKYNAVVRTAEQIAAEERAAAQQQEDEGEDQIITIQSEVATREAMDELAQLTEKMTLEKKQKRRRAKAGDVDMDDEKAPKVSAKSKGIKKTMREQKRYKKSRKQLLH